MHVFIRLKVCFGRSIPWEGVPIWEEDSWEEEALAGEEERQRNQGFDGLMDISK